MSAIIGVMLGSGFSPSLLAQVSQWLVPLAGLLLFMIAAGTTVIWYFRQVGGFDWSTSFFSGMPGGLIEMVTYGEERGGDARVIALVHSARILMVVLTLPFIIQEVEGVRLDRVSGGISVLDAPLTWAGWLIGCSLAGALLGRILQMPAKALLGPMVVSAAVHLVGFSDFKPPSEIIAAAQLVLGVVIGCRFAGTPRGLVLKILALTIGSTLILLRWMTLFAVLVAQISNFSVVTLMLAYSPGGLAEMSLIAVAMNVEVAVVASLHVIRVFLTMICAPLTFAHLGGLRGK